MGREALKQDNLRNPGVDSTYTIQNRLNWPLTFRNTPPTPRPFYLFVNKTNAPQNKTGTSLYTVDEKSETFSFSVARVLLIPQELLTGARSCLLEAPVSV